MDYTGRVTSGGPSDVRRLEGLVIRKTAVSQMQNNVYLLTCAESDHQLLIDAADDLPRIRRLIDEGSGRLDHVVTTHRHWDHVRALEAVIDATGARSYAGADDADGLPVPPDVRLVDGDRISVGAVDLEVIHLRGHTPGSVALAYRDSTGSAHIFTGDSLFPGGVGNTRNEGQSFTSLFADVTSRVFDRFGDDTWIYPGHGDDTTLGAERPHLDEWRERGW
ncbi:MBL fold metallo-hydrolase [Nostocoides sp. F2B08]|uniref:MBL fold metallo-hydrolase n=1 Tax=Nostocoides sp. F2B08 TaxID=2653936 RepID=UPI001262FD86|nr:MBL fold metallo-hydrolase [Tetrasphaera sp. F2B08]KAB7744553.1 MBL fold metallo-hydrolase [Tetrasphaera sp. F2B08]